MSMIRTTKYAPLIATTTQPLAILLMLGMAMVAAETRCWGQAGADEYGKDIYWNATPNDVNNLLKNLQKKGDISYNMDVRSLSQVSIDPGRNPVLFRSGHYNFSYKPEMRAKLREYMLSGGMIIYNTGLGSAPFYRSVVKELKEMFPEQPLQRLTSDHPIFHSYFDVDRVEYTEAVAKSGYKGNEPWFDAIEINCRVVALVSRWGLAVGWQDSVKEEYQAYQPKSAYELGMNIFSYASAMRAWAKNAAQSMKFVNRDESQSDKVALVQVVYDGVWKTRHNGLSVLLQTFNQRTDVPVHFGVKELRLSSPGIFNAPMLYMTGHEHFTLGPKEGLGLRQYLKNGGLLFAEACCGRKGFDLAFRQYIKGVLPHNPLRPIPASATLFAYPYALRTVGLTPTLAQELQKQAMPPRLEGIVIDGHMAVIYSRFGLSGGWEMSQSPYARGYDDVSSLKLGQCVLMHAVTQ